MKIDRYELDLNVYGGGNASMEVYDQGEWVKYDDHKAIVDTLEARIQELQDKLEFCIPH